MRRTRIELDQVADRANLELAVWKAARGKRGRPEVASYLAGLSGRVDKRSASTHDGGDGGCAALIHPTESMASEVFLAGVTRHSELDRLAADILAGRAPRGEFREFFIHDPKRRLIHAACFADRVLHHAILNRAEATFERTLVDSSFACRPGRGVHAAIRHVQAREARVGWVELCETHHPTTDAI